MTFEPSVNSSTTLKYIFDKTVINIDDTVNKYLIIGKSYYDVVVITAFVH